MQHDRVWSLHTIYHKLGSATKKPPYIHVWCIRRPSKGKKTDGGKPRVQGSNSSCEIINYWTKEDQQHEKESLKRWGRPLAGLGGQAAQRARARLCCLCWHKEQEVWGWASSARLEGKDPFLARACHEAPAPAGGCHHRVHWAPERIGSTRNQAHEMLFLTTAHCGPEGLSRHIAAGWESILRECYHMFISFLSSPLEADTALGHCLKGSTSQRGLMVQSNSVLLIKRQNKNPNSSSRSW